MWAAERLCAQGRGRGGGVGGSAAAGLGVATRSGVGRRLVARRRGPGGGGRLIVGAVAEDEHGPSPQSYRVRILSLFFRVSLSMRCAWIVSSHPTSSSSSMTPNFVRSSLRTMIRSSLRSLRASFVGRVAIEGLGLASEISIQTGRLGVSVEVSVAAFLLGMVCLLFSSSRFVMRWLTYRVSFPLEPSGGSEDDSKFSHKIPFLSTVLERKKRPSQVSFLVYIRQVLRLDWWGL